MFNIQFKYNLSSPSHEDIHIRPTGSVVATTRAGCRARECVSLTNSYMTPCAAVLGYFEMVERQEKYGPHY